MRHCVLGSLLAMADFCFCRCRCPTPPAKGQCVCFTCGLKGSCQTDFILDMLFWVSLAGVLVEKVLRERECILSEFVSHVNSWKHNHEDGGEQLCLYCPIEKNYRISWGLQVNLDVWLRHFDSSIHVYFYIRLYGSSTKETADVQLILIKNITKYYNIWACNRLLSECPVKFS